jgi:ATP-dependent DNA helicase RecG
VEDLTMLCEGKTLELKQDLSSAKNILKTLVAFANTAGGKVIIGVEDKTKAIVGIEQPLDEEERLANIIADGIMPRLVPEIEMNTIAGKTLLVVRVYPSNSRPHYLKSAGIENGVYVRLGSSNRQADQELIAELCRSVGGLAFDEMTMPELSINDLDRQAIEKSFGRQRQLNEGAFQTLKLVRIEQGKLVPTKGAMLLFGRERVFHFPDAWVQCGRFIGTDKAQIFDHIEIEESLPQTVDSIMLFLKKHAFRGADFVEVRRRDLWSIPVEILREVVINALVHADYSQRGAPIRVAFFDDRIEVENPGILLPGMTIEDMKQGTSKIRNPVIARVFRELKLIEQWGSGVGRIFREAQDLGLPPPEIIEAALRLRFIVRLSQSMSMGSSTVLPELRLESRLGSRLESRLESPLAAKVFLRLAEESEGKAGLAQFLGHKAVSGELHKQVKRLLEAGWIEQTIPEKPTSRLQKYRLTAAGKSLLAQIQRQDR